jgi:hypothetical protein
VLYIDFMIRKPIIFSFFNQDPAVGP